MFNKKYNELINAVIMILLLILINFIIKIYRVQINDVSYYFRGFIVILATTILQLTKKLNIRKITLGFIIFTLSSFSYYLEIFHIFPSFINNFVDGLMIISLIISLFGLLELINNYSKFNSRLKKLAFYDSLTNLPNRNFLLRTCPTKELNCEEDTCQYCAFNNIIQGSKKSAFLFLDIDDFKLINDYLGHFNGDLLLKEIANRLSNYIRNDDVVIHLSGDEFVIIINNVDRKRDIALIAKDIISLINQPIILNNKKEVNISCSIGIAIYPDHTNNIERLMKKADIAMNEAKKEGKNRYFIFNIDLNNSFENRFLAIEDLKHAIKNNEFVIHYQPKAKIDTNEIIGLEALVRWNHPKHGLIYPNDFIGFAEELKLIDEIDKIVLNKVCEQLNTWKNEGKKIYNIAVNVSPLYFMDKSFIPTFDLITSSYNIDPSNISIEITESIALDDVELTISKLKELKQRNVKIYIDDFGKGYSSLLYLKQFPIDYLKIDKKFIDGIKINNVDETIIKYIIEVTNLLDIKVISEGVETNQQLDYLKERDCFGYQGYLLSKPQPIDKLKL